MEQALELAGILHAVRPAGERGGREARATPATYNREVVELNRLEEEGDRVARAAISSLFAGGIDPLVIVRWKDVFECLEQAIDACDRVGNLLEGIALQQRCGLRAATRRVLGCIDIGSNTTRLLVADASNGQLRELVAQRAFTRIGKSLLEGGAIPAEKIEETAEVVRTQTRVAREVGAREIVAVATAAIRNAPNRDELCTRGRGGGRHAARGAVRRGGGAALVRGRGTHARHARARTRWR